MKTNKHIPLIYGVISLLIAIFCLIVAVRIRSWILSFLVGGILGGFFLWLAVINFRVGLYAGSGLLKKLTNKGNLTRRDETEIKKLINKA